MTADWFVAGGTLALAGATTWLAWQARNEARAVAKESTAVKQRLRSAWKLDDHAAALDRLRTLAAELDHSHPGAAASLLFSGAVSAGRERFAKFSPNSANPQ